MRFQSCLLALTLLALGPPASPACAGGKPAAPRTENVIVVTLDGFRWQEFFGGADETLLNKEFGGVRDLDWLKKRYWRGTAEERRSVLLPFFWNTLAKEGQIF